jgi:RES domain-containing protein
MIVYRITHKDFSNKLIPSGIENRWNLAGQFVIYTSASKALACLENLVHASGETLGNDLYLCLEIFIPQSAGTTIISLKDLPADFTGEEGKLVTTEIGNEWYISNSNLLLQVPSAIIPSENNIIINTRHNDFRKVKIKAREQFKFDIRLIK